MTTTHHETTEVVAVAHQISETTRPVPVTMPGMIYEASKVLEWAIDPNCGGLHPYLFGPDLKGICFISIIEAGFVWSGHMGTGIVLARRPDGSWSAPSAIGVSGVGWGFIIGASMRHLVYLIYEDSTMKAMSGDVGVRLGTKIEAALGTWGRSAEITGTLTNKGVAPDVCVHYSQGGFCGISVEGAFCNPRTRVNEKFYGRKVSPSEILFQDTVQIPEGTVISDVYAKLNALCSDKSIYLIKIVATANANGSNIHEEKEESVDVGRENLDPNQERQCAVDLNEVQKTATKAYSPSLVRLEPWSFRRESVALRMPPDSSREEVAFHRTCIFQKRSFYFQSMLSW